MTKNIKCTQTNVDHQWEHQKHKLKIQMATLIEKLGKYHLSVIFKYIYILKYIFSLQYFWCNDKIVKKDYKIFILMKFFSWKFSHKKKTTRNHFFMKFFYLFSNYGVQILKYLNIFNNILCYDNISIYS
jgi:hypothetical protein